MLRLNDMMARRHLRYERDIQALLNGETTRSPLNLTSRQQEIAEACIADVVTHGTMSEEWWRRRLCLPAAQDPADDY